MNKTEIIQQLQQTTIEERILIIEAILETIRNDMYPSSHPLKPQDNPLRGKVIRYDRPYEPVATEDWDILA